MELWRKQQDDQFQWGSCLRDERWRAWVGWRDGVIQRRRKLGFPVGDAQSGAKF
jgi:hypothetical protein